MRPLNRPGRTGETGLTLTDLLVSLSVFMLVFLAVLGAYTHGTTLSLYTSRLMMIQDGLRVGLDILERDLRMIGFGLPHGEEIGESTVWTPAVFHATPTEVGFRASIEGTQASITCTPNSSNNDCDLTTLRVDSTRRYEELGCEVPNDPGVPLKLVVVAGDGAWEPTECGGVDPPEGSLSVSAVSNVTFTAGISDVLSIEQVYYRYVPSAQPPYGVLERHVRYDNEPDDNFPPSGAEWTVIADHLIDFWLEYRDASGAVLSGDPLSPAQRATVNSIGVLVEGYDRIGPQGKVQRLQIQSEVLIRNSAL